MSEIDLESEKRKIDAMSQEDMARLWRFAPSGHPYFVSDTPLWHHFNEKFQGFTPEISRRVGWVK